MSLNQILSQGKNGAGLDIDCNGFKCVLCECDNMIIPDGGDLISHNINVTNELKVKCDDTTQLLLKTPDYGTSGQVISSNGDGTLKFESLPSLSAFVENPMTSSLDCNMWNITNADVIRTTRIQNQLGSNNIQLNTSDIQITGNMDMTNNDIINANEVTSNAMTANTMVLNGGGFGAKALILNGSLFSIPLQIDSTSAVNVTKNAKYPGGQLSGIVVSTESISSLNNIGVRKECQYITTTATEDHITNYGVDYAIRTIPTGSSTSVERFKIGGDGVTYNTGDFDVVGNTLMYGTSRAKLGATDSFSVTDDTPGFSLLKFNISNSSILSQIQHTFSNGLIPVADLVGSIGSSIKRFSNIWTGSINGLTPVGGVYSGTSDGALVGPGGVETSLLPLTGVGSLTVPANGFKEGDLYHMVVSGEIPIGDKDDVVTIKVCQNGICFATTSVDMEDSVGVSNFELECDMCIRSTGISGSIITNCEFSFNKSLLKDWRGNRHIELSTIDTTIPTTLSVSATFTGDLNSTMITKLFYLRKQY